MRVASFIISSRKCLTASAWSLAYRVLRFRAIPKIAMAGISGKTAKSRFIEGRNCHGKTGGLGYRAWLESVRHQRSECAEHEPDQHRPQRGRLHGQRAGI